MPLAGPQPTTDFTDIQVFRGDSRQVLWHLLLWTGSVVLLLILVLVFRAIETHPSGLLDAHHIGLAVAVLSCVALPFLPVVVWTATARIEVCAAGIRQCTPFRRVCHRWADLQSTIILQNAPYTPSVGTDRAPAIRLHFLSGRMDIRAVDIRRQDREALVSTVAQYSQQAGVTPHSLHTFRASIYVNASRYRPALAARTFSLTPWPYWVAGSIAVLVAVFFGISVPWFTANVSLFPQSTLRWAPLAAALTSLCIITASVLAVIRLIRGPRTLTITQDAINHWPWGDFQTAEIRSVRRRFGRQPRRELVLSHCWFGRLRIREKWPVSDDSKVSLVSIVETAWRRTGRPIRIVDADNNP